MVKLKSLVGGFENYLETNRYYDDWSTTYDQTLLSWRYRAPKKSSLIVKNYLRHKPKNILDLACGTGFFAEEIKKIYPKSLIDGVDLSKKILAKAKSKNIYNKLICFNFDKKFSLKKKYDLISCIGALTYTKDSKKLFSNIYNNTNFNGYFVFTHRVDLWKKSEFSNFLLNLSHMWKEVFISRPILYLPNNSEFTNKIKIKIVLLKKIEIKK